MPEIERMTVRPGQLREGDSIMAVEDETHVVTGKRALADGLGVPVFKVDVGTNTAKIDSSRGLMRIKLAAELTIDRSVPTAEERAIAQRQWNDELLRRHMNTALGEAERVKAEILKEVSAESDWRLARRLFDLAIKVAQAREIELLWLQVLNLLIREEEPATDIVEAFEIVAARTVQELLEPHHTAFNRSTSITSNMEEDAIADAKRDFVSSSKRFR